MSEEDKIIEKLGYEAEKLVKSDLGKYLDGVYQQDLNEAKLALLEIDPFSYKTLTDLQNQIAALQFNVKLAQKLQSYLSDTIINGRQATHQLENE